MTDLTAAADNLLADILDADLAWDDVAGLLTSDADARADLAFTHAAELGLDLDEEALEAEAEALAAVLAELADAGITSLADLQAALGALAGSLAAA